MLVLLRLGAGRARGVDDRLRGRPAGLVARQRRGGGVRGQGAAVSARPPPSAWRSSGARCDCGTRRRRPAPPFGRPVWPAPGVRARTARRPAAAAATGPRRRRPRRGGGARDGREDSGRSRRPGPGTDGRARRARVHGDRFPPGVGDLGARAGAGRGAALRARRRRRARVRPGAAVGAGPSRPVAVGRPRRRGRRPVAVAPVAARAGRRPCPLAPCRWCRARSVPLPVRCRAVRCRPVDAVRAVAPFPAAVGTAARGPDPSAPVRAVHLGVPPAAPPAPGPAGRRRAGSALNGSGGSQASPLRMTASPGTVRRDRLGVGRRRDGRRAPLGRRQRAGRPGRAGRAPSARPGPRRRRPGLAAVGPRSVKRARRQDGHGRDPRPGGRAERHGDAVAGGEPGDDVEPEALGDGQVDLARVREQLVGLGEVVGRHAHAPVLDGEQLPALVAPVGPGPDRHGGLGRGEADGVLGELGQQVGEVGDRGAGDGGAVVDGEHDAVEVLGLRDGGAHDVAQRARAPTRSGGSARRRAPAGSRRCAAPGWRGGRA